MNDVYNCKYCDKSYKSRSSRSNHIKRIHKTDDNRNLIIDNPIDNHPIINNNIKEATEYSCRKYNKSLNFIKILGDMRKNVKLMKTIKLKADLDNAENNTDDEDDYELSDKETINVDTYVLHVEYLTFL